MVDAAQPMRRSQAGNAADRTGGISVRVVHGADDAAIAAYRAACSDARFAPAQDPAWISAWTRHGGRALVVATVEFDGRPATALALEVAKQGPFRLARFVGDDHANGNFPAVTPEAADMLTAPVLRRLILEVHAARPDIDLIALERQLPEFEGLVNPFLAFPSRPSPDLALAVDLDGGFTALLKRASGKRKSKKHRSQSRRFEAAGGFRRIEARTPEEVDHMLSAFFDMKHVRFAKMGIRNVFAPASVQTAFRALFREAFRDSPPRFVVHGLEVGGKLRAVTGSSRTRDRIVCEFSAIAEDELSGASPGEFLFFENIQAACAEGLRVYDFSVGDEYYKRLWCDIETLQRDVFVPLTAKGRLLALALNAKSQVMRAVKKNPRLWTLVKRLRRQAAGQG